MIVADANLLAYLLLPGDRTAEAEAVFAADPAWVVPPRCLSELRSVALTYVRAKAMSLADAQRFMTRALALVEGRVGMAESRRILALAAKSNVTAYDAEYVALAVELAVPLVTTDQQVLRAFPRVAIAPDTFVER